MTVKEVIALAAEHLGRSELAKEALAAEGTSSQELAALVRCYNLVENEIALEYCRLYHEEEIAVTEGRAVYSALSFAPIEIVSVTDGAGRALAFEAAATHLAVKGAGSFVRVRYAYTPSEKTLADEGAFSGAISARLLSFGVACEACLAEGRYREAACWEERYREALRAANALHRPLRIRSRRWV